MRDEDKPFVMYRMGGGGLRIVPRGARGWQLMLGWMALSLVPIGGFALFSSTDPEQQASIVALAVFLLAMAGWAIGGIIWMRARAEVVDLEELLRIKRERDRGRR